MRLLFTLLPSLVLLFSAGCTITSRDRIDAARHAERMRAEAIRSRYWAAQAAEKPMLTNERFELLPLAVPERTENGVIRTSSTELLRLPRLP